MNLIATVSVCERADLVVVNFEAVAEYPCGHPRTPDNTYVYKRHKWCKRCRANRERRAHALRRRQNRLA